MGKTVLIVDDAATIRQLVSFTLKGAGYDVVAADNGKDALYALNGRSVAMVITDLNMPQMDGIEFIKQLRSTEGHRFTPVLMLTTEWEETKKQAGKAAGASGWIVKPFRPDKLVALVDRFMNVEGSTGPDAQKYAKGYRT